jgi:hypothetical protein
VDKINRWLKLGLFRLKVSGQNYLLAKAWSFSSCISLFFVPLPIEIGISKSDLKLHRTSKKSRTAKKSLRFILTINLVHLLTERYFIGAPTAKYQLSYQLLAFKVTKVNNCLV